jgi:hypothetical protein
LKKTALLFAVGVAALVLTISACSTGTSGKPNIALFDVTSGTTAVNPGDTIDFGTVKQYGVPTSATRNFRVDNTGDAALALTGTGNKVVIGGAGPGNFNIPTQPPSSIPAGGSVTFDIVFTGTTSGGTFTRDATIGIASDDPDLASISFNVTGTDKYS